MPVPDSTGPPPERTVEVPLRRLLRWLDGFAERHGPWQAAADRPAVAGAADDGPTWLVTATDGSRAVVHAPGWLPVVHPEPVASLAALAALRPSFGAVLIRRAGYAVGLFQGIELVERKVGTRHVHGRTAAGGWSQQRYARRRANQADEIVDAASRAANRILGHGRDSGRPVPVFLATGGDRSLLAASRDLVDPVVAALPIAAHLGIGTPDAAVLAGLPDRVLAVRIEIVNT